MRFFQVWFQGGSQGGFWRHFRVFLGGGLGGNFEVFGMYSGSSLTRCCVVSPMQVIG